MPVPGFLSSFADKAQAAVNAGHLPIGRPTSPGSRSDEPGSFRGGPFESIQHQLKTLGQQYSSSTPIQRIITAEKGVALDFDGVSKDSKTQSKELYTWGQAEAEDVKDVTDRLAYLNFVQGSLSNTLALQLDTARAQLKNLRDTETAITPRRNIRAGLSSQIARIEHEQQKGYERRLEDLKAQLKKHEDEDSDQEKQIQILKRKAIKESEQKKWDAIREYGEKLVLLAQAAAPITAALPIIPPNPGEYKGAPATAAARASLQRALDNYKTGHINLTPLSDLSRSDTQSFGESHKSELSSMTSEPGIPLTPPAKQTTLPAETTSSAASPLENAPTPLPTTSSSPPVSSGENGPGPASGSLHDIKGASATAGPKSGGLAGNVSSELGYGQPPAGTPAKFESAEEEKKRLQREDRERLLAAQGPAPAPVPASDVSTSYESAEEEKKRLEREEREKLLGQSSSGGDGDELPAYQEM